MDNPSTETRKFQMSPGWALLILNAAIWLAMLLAKLAAPGLFAVVNPFCAVEVAADKMPSAVQGATVWIICGGADGLYTAGSRRMFNALRDAKVDALYTEVPEQSHRIWPDFYASNLPG